MTSVSAKYIKFIQTGLDLNEVESATEELENENSGSFLGLIKKICIHEKTGVEHRLVLKIAPRDPAIRVARPIALAFNREYEIYSKILPELENFQTLHKISAPFTGYARFYGGSIQEGDETILMEDLSFKGFKCHNEYDGMNFKHMSLMFEEYAKLHAASLALGYKDPGKFKELTASLEQNIFQIREAKNPERYNLLRQTVTEMGKRAIKSNKQAERAHKKFTELFPDFWKNYTGNPEKEILVISHGDCHPNNMLFAYKNEVNVDPKKICFIDWQLSSKETPIHDLSFALCGCASKEALSRIDDLFGIYHKTLAQNLREFGCNPEKIFSYEDFHEHWKRHFLYGLYRGQMTLKLILMSPRQKQEAAKFPSILDILANDSLSNPTFTQRMQDLFEILGERWLKH
ncbi:uncharacterized protein LOC126735213 [Anthonomus grandis grandis]|uniref:uncharacterized protein LOC126735213 n=1 Tax=Anthonomus grandis grandis TaxID=2921223 RepID=UPI0021657211|nr:uncharacterized protein LOC126735213 [Anthonomus grandis grandis]